MNKVRQDWDNRPPTQDSNPIYSVDDNKNSCEDFFKFQYTTHSTQRQFQEAGPELAFLNVSRQQNRLSQYKKAEQIDSRSPALSYLEKITEKK